MIPEAHNTARGYKPDQSFIEKFQLADYIDNWHLGQAVKRSTEINEYFFWIIASEKQLRLRHIAK